MHINVSLINYEPAVGRKKHVCVSHCVAYKFTRDKKNVDLNKSKTKNKTLFSKVRVLQITCPEK